MESGLVNGGMASADSTHVKAAASRASLVAAVICCFLLAAVEAIAVNIPILRQFLGGGVVYDQNVRSLNLGQTVNGYTNTVTDCVGDD